MKSFLFVEIPVIEVLTLYELLFASERCLWVLVEDFLGDFWICVVDSPLTGYLFLLKVAPLLLRMLFFMAVGVEVLSLGCFGKTKAFVCFNKYWSLHSAEINGKSKLRLFSRSVRMSNISSFFSSSLSSMPDLLGLFIFVITNEGAVAEEADGNGWFLSRF